MNMPTVFRATLAGMLCVLVACAGDNGTAATTTSAASGTDVGVTLTSSSTIVAIAGAPFSFDATKAVILASARGKLTYAVAINPANSGLSASAGRVTGTPDAPGTIQLIITVTDATGRSATRLYTVSVQASAPIVLAAANTAQSAMVGAPYSYDATRAGTAFLSGSGAALTYSVNFSPAANGLSATAGRITGTPLSPAVITATITARDASGNTRSNDFPIVAFASDVATPVITASFSYSDVTSPIPTHFANGGSPGGAATATDNSSLANPITNAGATLGRVLFYDRRLSANDQVACASCHQQQFSFGDTAVLSRGFAGGLTGRHSMALANARYYARGRFFWDERAATLEDQVLQPIQNSVEMGMTLPNVITKLSVSSYYPALFQAAFGSTDITSDRVSRALAQFVRSMVSGNAKYDQAFAGAGPPNFPGVFTADELAGQQLYNGAAGCARCHNTDAFVSDNIHNTGLDATITDVGAGGGRFKAPSLRNVGARTSFMHDGRFRTLDQVVEFYNSGIQNNPTLDPRLRGPNGPQRLNLNAAQKAQLVAYLRTLTDNQFLTNPKFANPFP